VDVSSRCLPGAFQIAWSAGEIRGAITERHRAGAADSGQGWGKNQFVGRLQDRGRHLLLGPNGDARNRKATSEFFVDMRIP